MTRRCRICGCTDAIGCASGCGWVTEDLCDICDTLMWWVARFCARYLPPWRTPRKPARNNGSGVLCARSPRRA